MSKEKSDGNENINNELQRELGGPIDDRGNNTFDIDRDLQKDQSMDYEEKRVLLKLGTFKSALMLIQGTVGISLFTLQKPLEMVGIAWGGFITVLSCYITVYGLVQLSSLAAEIEVDFSLKRKIKNFDELTRQFKAKSAVYVKWLMMISGVCMMFASTVGNLLLISSHIRDILGLNDYVVKLIIFVIISLVFLLIVEPENIQYVNTYLTASLMILGYLFFGRSLYMWYDTYKPGPSKVKLMDIKYTGMFAGNVAYAFEVASNYLSLRLTSSSEVRYTSLTWYMMVLVGLNYFLLAGSSLYAFEPEEITDNLFEMHAKKSGSFWNSLIYVFMVNTLYTFTFNTIFTGEIIESIPAIHDRIANEKGVFDRTKLFLMRVTLWGIAVVISIYAKNVIYILNFSGSVFTPIISYFGPIYLRYLYTSQKGGSTPIAKKIHDTLYILVALTISFWGIMNSF